LGERGAGVVELGAVDGVVELVERLAGLDDAALAEQAALDDAVDLRPHLGLGDGAGAAWQLAGERYRLGLQGDDGDLRRRHLRRATALSAGGAAAFVLAAAGEE